MTIALSYLAGRCVDGFERDGGTRIHMLIDGRALCGATYGRRSAGWSTHPRYVEVTCPRCLRKLIKQLREAFRL